ncbi:hypothetical protein F4553_004773 [Allocatelliglobosispora scoriae]|uniref:Uncharacterized protein n=1 Tax=Allocatelliglobosispora scoriae TaxID=643052 RepID=A0A841BT59_9ACTN|nr:hypothetical protein [Allocatelliglobosispora scoriae]MBB5871394.1 hypothetical protein [Allocatelliglobosispora scoriae]
MRTPRKADLITVAVSVLFAAVGLAVSPSPAHAAPSCAPSNPTGSYFDGFWHNNAAYPQYNWEGASAYIKVWYPGTCSGGFRPWTNAWVMIAPSSTQSGGVGHAQAGYVRDVLPNGTEQFVTFGEFANDANGDGVINTSSPSEWTRIYWQNAVSGTAPAYRVLWNASTGRLNASYNGTVFATSQFNPYNSAWRQPFSPQFMGETKYQTGNMPGVTGARVNFTALGAQRASDHALVSMSCSMSASNQNTTLWGLQASSCTAFDIWQK